MFAAGFQDHQIGPVLGVDGNTGAGGANVWTHDLLLQLYPPSLDGSPYEPLPRGAGLRVAIRHTLRVGDNAGTLLEDLGVVPTHPYQMTRADVLNGNVDLINRAAELLAGQPARALAIQSISTADDRIHVTVATRGINRLDVFLNGRPQTSLDVRDGQTQITLPAPTSGSTLELKGYDAEELVAARRAAV